MDGTIHLYKDLLGYILGVFCVLDYADGCVINPVLVGIHQILKSGFITIAKALYQLKFIQQLEGLGFEAVTYENMLCFLYLHPIGPVVQWIE